MDILDVKAIGKILTDITKITGIPTYCTLATTAVAPVAALPTTAAHFVLWNGDFGAQTPRTLIVHTIGSIITTTAAAAITLGMAAHMGTSGSATKPTGTASTIKKLYGTGADVGAGVGLDTVTITNDGVWHPVGQQIVDANTANLMLSVIVDSVSISGRYKVAPGVSFALATLCNAAGTAVCKPFVIWSEAQYA